MASRIGFRTTSLSGVVAVACALALVLAAPGDAARRAQRVVPVAPSLADRFAVDSPAMTVALAIAERHWGRPACGGRITLS